MTVGTDKKYKPKVYRNGKTYAQNVADGTFQPIGALKFQNEIKSEVAELKEMLVNIAEKLASKLLGQSSTLMWGLPQRIRTSASA